MSTEVETRGAGRLIKGPPGTKRFLLAWTPDRAADAAVDVLLGYAAAATTSSPVQAGLVMAIAFVPQLVFMLVGGAVGDRVGPFRLARVTLLLRLAVLAGLAVAMGTTSAWVAIAVLGALLGVLDGFHFPALEGVATLLGREGDEVGQGQLQGAMDSAGRTAGLVMAPLVGALLSLGTTVPMAVVAVGMAGAWLALAGIRPMLRTPEPADTDTDDGDSGAGMWADIKGGLKAAGAIRYMPFMLAVYAAGNLLTAPAVFLGVPTLAQENAWSGLTYGIVFGSFAAGGAIGGMAVNWARHRVTQSLRVALLSEVVSVVGMVVLMTCPPALAAVGGLVAGLFSGISAGLLGGDIRAATPAEFASRIASLRSTCIYALIPLGYLVFGGLSAVTSTGLAGASMAVTLGVLALIALVLLPGRATASDG